MEDYAPQLREVIKELVDEKFSELEAAVVLATKNGMSGDYMMEARKAVYEAVYLANSSTRRQVQRDGSYR